MEVREGRCGERRNGVSPRIVTNFFYDAIAKIWPKYERVLQALTRNKFFFLNFLAQSALNVGTFMLLLYVTSYLLKSKVQARYR